MDYEKILRTLVQYNAWRRCDKEPNLYKMVNSKDLNEALEVAIRALQCYVGRAIDPEEDNIPDEEL